MSALYGYIFRVRRGLCVGYVSNIMMGELCQKRYFAVTSCNFTALHSGKLQRAEGDIQCALRHLLLLKSWLARYISSWVSSLLHLYTTYIICTTELNCGCSQDDKSGHANHTFSGMLVASQVTLVTMFMPRDHCLVRDDFDSLLLADHCGYWNHTDRWQHSGCWSVTAVVKAYSCCCFGSCRSHTAHTKHVHYGCHVPRQQHSTQCVLTPCWRLPIL